MMEDVDRSEAVVEISTKLLDAFQSILMLVWTLAHRMAHDGGLEGLSKGSKNNIRSCLFFPSCSQHPILLKAFNISQEILLDERILLVNVHCTSIFQEHFRDDNDEKKKKKKKREERH